QKHERVARTGSTPITDSITRNQQALQDWLTTSAANKSQITTTVYDQSYSGFTTETPLIQRNLRNRVSYVSYSAGNNPAQFAAATFYSYDIPGNVDTLVQDYGTAPGGPNLMNAN